MSEIIYRIILLTQYCAEQGITEIKAFRKSMKSLGCIFKAAGQEFFSEELYQKGLELAGRRQFEVTQQRLTVKVQGEKSPADHARTVTMSPEWIKTKKLAIQKVEVELANAADLDEKFKVKQQLVKLRAKLAEQEAAYAESLAFVRDFVGKDDVADVMK